jgi:RHS repeat-associated protein
MGTWTLGSLISKTYAWQDDDNITAITDNLNSANNRTFGYDAIHRLTTASGPWGAGSYTYDANGNRQSKTEGASNTSYAYTAGTNRLATATGSEPATYGYDANGNTTSDGAHTYQYSQRDRLATVDSGTTGTYSYDGDGRRVKKVASGVTTLYFYDPDGKLLEEYIPATGAGKDYVWLPGSYEPLARVDFAMSDADNGNVLRVTKSSPNVHLDWSLDGTSGPFVLMRSLSFTFSNPVYLGPGQTAKTFDDAVLNNGQSYAYEAFRRTLTDTLYFYHDDHLGTPIAMTNTSGALVWRAEHTPFGGIYALTVGTITNNLRFPGQYFDGETGLAQNYFRDYRSTIGRYWSPDQLFALDVTHGVWPAELSPGQYAYVESSPVNYIDPFGLWRWYGNWGGPNWTGGQKGTWDTIDRSKAKPPIDKQDACYMDHDICYGGCRECKQCKPKARADCFRDCDRKLVKCLRGLGNDPSNNWKAKAAARYFEHSNPGPNS